jgi:hypothetical protein
MFQESSHLKPNPLFRNKKIYFSASIKGAPELDPTLAWKLVSYMAKQGADVLSEHVAAQTKEDMRRIFSERSGKSIYDLFVGPQSASNIREIDMKWVDEATHFVALVNGPSHGVGMEIERALLKPLRGLPSTPILCLVHNDVYDKLSCMIKGISQEECPVFYLKRYENFEEACACINDFMHETCV